MRLRVKNWKTFQHYDHRCPPWIKLHFKILHSKDWVTFNDAERVLAIACMLVASQDEAKDGSFDADPDYVRRVAYLNSTPDFNPLITLGFLETLADASACKQKIQNGVTETETEKKREETTTTSRRRRTRTEILTPYPPEVSAVVNEILSDWPKTQPKDSAPIRLDVPMTAERIDGLLKESGVTPEILKQAARGYLAEKKNYYRAPQFFFGPSSGEKTPPWIAYARMSVHQEVSRGL
jgi:hypothetical protein